jgi:hypothetical protein
VLPAMSACLGGGAVWPGLFGSLNRIVWADLLGWLCLIQ